MIFIARFSEICLKSDFVRNMFTKKLADNIKRSAKACGIKLSVKRTRDCLLIESEDRAKTRAILKKTFGISWFSECEKANNDKVLEKARETGKRKAKGKTFAVRVKRGWKGFPKKSKEAEIAIADGIDEKVNLTNPDVTIFVDIMKGFSCIYFGKEEGPGGLPVGSAGKVAALMSSGIDSPAAAWLMMKRGCYPVIVYIDNSPYSGKESFRKAKKLAGNLSEWSGGFLKLYRITNGKYMKNVAESKYTCVLCKRMMYRLAEKISDKENCQGIVTGESVAQVASQTLRNLKTIDSAVSLPVYRPLIGLDKIEIERIAKDIGTYEISSEKEPPCGAVPKSPATRSPKEAIEDAEKNLDAEGTAEKAISEGRTYDIRSSGIR